MANDKDYLGINANAPDTIRHYNNFEEYGRLGQKRYGGIFFEEFLTQLRGQKGIQVYREMADNDSVVGAILFAIEMLIRHVTWDVEPQGKSAKDKEASQFIRECMDDMEVSWQDNLADILSFLTYGWSFHEICYKRRLGRNKDKAKDSRYNDGLIAWRKLPIRSQDTLFEWLYDEEGELVGMRQQAPPDYAIRDIPLEKALLFRTKINKGEPEGRSILRTCYKDYYYKKRFQEIEGIGVERDLAGFPVMTAPEGFDIYDSSDPSAMQMLFNAQAIVQNVRRDEQEGMVLPFGWKFELLGGGSKRQFDVGAIIDRYDKRITMSVMADFLMLGQDGSGSLALSTNKTTLFTNAIGTFLDIICGVFNTSAIPKLIDLNGDHFKGVTDYPKMVHGDVAREDIEQFMALLEKGVGMGVIVPDDSLSTLVRDKLKLGPASEGAQLPQEEPKKIDTEVNQNEEEEGDVKPKEETDA